MRSDKNVSAMPTRQKIVGLLVVVILAFVIWQIVDLVRGPTAPANTMAPAATATKPATATTTTTTSTTTAKSATTTAPTVAATGTPQAASLFNQKTISQNDAVLMQQQQQSQAQYIAALSDLQMLKVQRDIAETNQAIMTAKLSAATSQKKIGDLVTPQTPPADLLKAVSPQPVTPISAGPPQAETAPYTIVSVSQIQYQWNAVISYNGKLFSVRVGDVLPADGSKVVSIDRGGITLAQKDGTRRRISLVPII